MALPKAYLTSTKNLAGILNSIKSGQAPDRFTQRFLETLGYKSAADRLVIGLLKQLDFLDQEGKPKDRYFQFIDQTQSEAVLADAIKETYEDLFTIRKDAQNFSKIEVVNKVKTLSQGAFSDSVIGKFAATFLALCAEADFSNSKVTSPITSTETTPPIDLSEDHEAPTPKPPNLSNSKLSLGGVHYNIQLILPPSRDPKVYDALFRSLKEHLID